MLAASRISIAVARLCPSIERLQGDSTAYGIDRDQLPDGAVDQNIKGATYFTFGGAYFQPFYSGSSVIYEVVAKPA